VNTRPTTTIVLAAVLIVVVMGTALVLTLGRPPEAKFAANGVWTQDYATAESMNIIDLTGDGQKDLFVQNTNNLRVLDAQGQTVFNQDFTAPLVSTLGDVNGDGVEDIVAFAPGESSPVVTVISKGAVLWTATAQDMGTPVRAAVIRFKGGTQIIAGDQRGQLRAFSARGEALWDDQLGSIADEGIRGLDDAVVGDDVLLAAANHDGSVAAYNENGAVLWRYSYPDYLRRLRAYDLNGDKQGEIVLGGDAGQLAALDAATGNYIFNQAIGQTITEIRAYELDGNPSSLELAVGGKKGGVWAVRPDGSLLWSGSLSGNKVTELSGIDVDRDGADEVIAGDDGGALGLFLGKTGERYDLPGHTSAIGRLDVDKLGGVVRLVVADGAQVQALSVERVEAPFFYTPLVAGLIVSLAIAVAAWFVSTIPPKPATQLAVQNQSAESLEAHRRMLHESLADVDRLKAGGEMTPDAYLARLKELRGELAETEAALQKTGVALKPEIFKCPNCGGPLPLGTDKCEYCGQVVIA
jgi:outer membrane protein assembly factor BamB